jgi:hypothetical protein
VVGHKCVKSNKPSALNTKTEAEIYVSKKILGRSKSKRHWGRDMIIDNWEKLEEVIELIKCSLPINMQVELNVVGKPGRNPQPLPFDPEHRELERPSHTLTSPCRSTDLAFHR